MYIVIGSNPSLSKKLDPPLIIKENDTKKEKKKKNINIYIYFSLIYIRIYISAPPVKKIVPRALDPV